MSQVKDSSLAKSRIKRSHRIPARLADFREFPSNTLKSNNSNTEKSNSNSIINDDNTLNTSNNSTNSNSSITNANSNSTSTDMKPANINGLNNAASLKSSSKPSKQSQDPEHEPKLPETISKSPTRTEITSTKPTSTLQTKSKTQPSSLSQAKTRVKQSPQQEQRQQHQQLQQTKYITNQTITSQVAPNLQYGSRLLLNEPVYLPRNVANIAPMATNLQQMENYVRKLPFLSYKAQQCTAYYQQRIINNMTSNVDALIKIASHLEVADLLKLRLVSKSWKSIIDSDIVWQKVLVENSNIKNWSQFGEWLYKRGARHLHLKNIVPDLSWFEVCEYFKSSQMKLHSLLIESNDGLLNRNILELLCLLSNNHINLDVHWKVKGLVSDIGLVQIEFRTREKSCMTAEYEKDFYCYTAHPNLLTDATEHIMFDLYDVEDLFNDNSARHLSKKNPSRGLQIVIEAV